MPPAIQVDRLDSPPIVFYRLICRSGDRPVGGLVSGPRAYRRAPAECGRSLRSTAAVGRYDRPMRTAGPDEPDDVGGVYRADWGPSPGPLHESHYPPSAMGAHLAPGEVKPAAIAFYVGPRRLGGGRAPVAGVALMG